MIPLFSILIYTWFALTFLVFAGFLLISLKKYREPKYLPDSSRSVLVILPCKGLDHGMEENFSALKNQKYSNYDIIAVVDTPEDEAVQHLKNQNINIQTSDSQCSTCSGKVRAISTILEKHPDYDIYVVVDSDTRVNEDWLGKLVAPLQDERIGVSTTFPVFIPDGGMWSVVKAVWGMVGSGMMESTITRFVWGGSMAFRSNLVDESNISEFKSRVSDDVAIMNISKGKGKQISYVKGASPFIYSPDDFSTFFEWANRQTALSVTGSRRILTYGLIFYSLQIFLFASSLLLTAFVYLPLIFMFAPFVITASKNVSKSVKRRGSIFTVSFVMPFIYLVNLIIAGRMSNIKWRGNVYRLN